MALPRVNRLKARQHFTAVYKRGRRYNSQHLTLRYLRINSVELKIGISISQKVSKKAVMRNLIKRRIRNALRELLPAISLGWHLIIIVHPAAIECEYSQFLRELKEMLIKVEVMINGT